MVLASALVAGCHGTAPPAPVASPTPTVAPTPTPTPSPYTTVAALLDALAYPGAAELPGWQHPLPKLASRNYRTTDAPEAAAAHYEAWSTKPGATRVAALDPATTRAEAKALGFALAIAPPLAYEQPGRGMWRVPGGRFTVLLTYDPRRANADGEARAAAPSPVPSPPLYIHIEAAVE